MSLNNLNTEEDDNVQTIIQNNEQSRRSLFQIFSNDERKDLKNNQLKQQQQIETIPLIEAKLDNDHVNLVSPLKKAATSTQLYEPNKSTTHFFSSFDEIERKKSRKLHQNKNASQSIVDRLIKNRLNRDNVERKKSSESSSTVTLKTRYYNQHIYSSKASDLSIFNLSNTKTKRVVINVGGIRFETYSNTLKLVPESRLANLTETNSDYDPIRNEYFFDRHPGAFVAILNYFRTGKLHAPQDLCGNLFHDELIFWGILEYSIEPCCWSNYSQQRDADEALRQVVDGIDEAEEQDDNYYGYNVIDRDSTQSPRSFKKSFNLKLNLKNNIFMRFYHRCRPKVWKFFQDRHSSQAANVFFWISVIMLFLSIFNFVLETSPYFRVPYDYSTNFTLVRSDREANTVPHPILTYIEKFCNLFFFIELSIRFFSSPNKFNFIKNPYNLLELLAISPFFFPTQSKDGPRTVMVKIHNYLEVFYILRILRIFTLVPKYSGLKVLLLTVKASVGELFLYMILLFMTLMLFASFVFYAEQIDEVVDNKFESIIIGLWWAVVTMTTLGYGDIVPLTPLGRIIGALCALCGLLFLALPIPVIVNNFTTYYAHAKAHQRLKSYLNQRTGLFNRAIAVQFHNTPELEPREYRETKKEVHMTGKLLIFLT